MLKKLNNYLIKIEYDGTKFVGWQYQKNGISIQEKIEGVLTKLLKRKVRIVGAGRTDKGVHAMGQHANFKVEKKIENNRKFVDSMNFFLRKNLISIISLKKKNLTFHSRFSALERVYIYKIINRMGSLSLNNNRAWHIKKKIKYQAFKEGGKNPRGDTRLFSI